MSEQTIVIGLDGLGWDVIEPETLPTVHSIRENGFGTDLQSTHPPWTPSAWPSLQSGRNPGAHGVFDFFTRDGYDKRLVDRRDIEAPYLPDVADAAGKTALSINFPVTHPVPEYDNSAIVPGYLAPEDAKFHPEDIREAYEQEHGEYVIYPEYGADDDSVKRYIDVARGRRDMARFLDDRHDWDLLAVQFQVTDSVFHDLDDVDARKQVLAAVDEFVSDIIELGTDPNVVVVSDHGMGTYHWTFYINSWLAANGYCEITEGDAEYFRNKKDELKADKDETTTPLSAALVAGMSTASKVGVTPQRVHSALSTVGLTSHVERLLPDDVLVSAQNQTVDWQQSEAFQIFFNSCGIHLNRADREPDGTVPESEYEQLRDELIEKLSAVTDPNGELVFESVKRKEAVYDGQNLDAAPDVVLFPRAYDYDISGSIVGPFRQFEHQNHKPNGIIAATGPSFEDSDTEAASLLDVAPTVAAALGIPVDSERDGRVLPTCSADITEAQWNSLVDIDYGAVDDTGNAVEERLANLGYME